MKFTITHSNPRKFTIVKSDVNIFSTLTLTSAGNGTGVAIFSIEVSFVINITLTGNARFYTDAGGTLDESTSWQVTPGATRTIYIRCSSGVSLFKIQHLNVIKILNYEGTINSPVIGGDVSLFTNLTFFETGWFNDYNTLSGTIEGMTKLTHMRVFGSNTLTGDFSELKSLTYFVVGGSNTIGGDITNMTQLTVLDNVSNPCQHTGDISGLINLTYLWLYGNCNVTGSINNLVSLNTLVITCTNDIDGDLANLPLLYILDMQGGNSLTWSRMINNTKIERGLLTSLHDFTTTNINQLLADLRTNKDEIKQTGERNINFTLSDDSGYYYGQGRGDQVYLEHYRTPTPPGTAKYWDISFKHTNLGVELVDQANWYNLAYWNGGAGITWSSSGGHLVTSSGNSYCLRTNFWEIGALYYMEYEYVITSYTIGLYCPHDGVAPDFITEWSAKYKTYFIPQSVDLYIHNIDAVGEVTSLSIKKVLT